MNNLQSPQILSDLYRDLRDRRLLPLVVVLVVGMAVVPIVLSSSPKSTPTPLPPSPVAAKSNAPTEPVVLANPGLRDYKRRLAGDAPKDPFIQQFAVPVAPADAVSAGSSAGSAGGTSSADTGTTTSTSGGSSGDTTTTTQQPQTQSKYYSFRVKVRAGQLGKNLKTYDSVGSLAPLPSKKVPALEFLGVNTDSNFNAKSAVFLVSSAVSSVDGEGSCSFAGSACQVLTLKPGEHEDMVWIDGLTYRVELVKFNLIARHTPPSAGGGDSNSGGGDSGSGQGGSTSHRQPGLHFSF